MSLFTKLFEAVHSWRRRRSGTKSRKRSDLTMEQLDHRQLLTVNFSGVVANDFAGINAVTLTNTNPVTTVAPGIVPLNLQGVIPGSPYAVSGIQIEHLAVSYDSTNDVLSVGVQGPPRGGTGQPNTQNVIAADSDNNGNSGTVNPAVSAIEPMFTDPPDMGGTKTYGITLDLKNPTVPDIAAGFPQTNPNPDPTAPKPFLVAKYLNNPGGNMFDNSNIFPQYTGNYYLANDPNHPNFEFQITHFSQLYQQVTGNPLTPTSNIGMGAFASNNQDTGLGDESFPAKSFPLNSATAPPPTPPPPPPPPPVVCSPTIYVNPHENYHVNTAHPSNIRVSVLGSSGFDPTTIIPSTVKFGDPNTIMTNGASPILNFENNVNHDQFPDETFVFNGLDVTLPPGITNAEIIGETSGGTFFSSQVKVFNRDTSFYTPAQINKQQDFWLAYDRKNGIDSSNGAVAPPPIVPKAAQQRAASMAIDDLYNPFKGERVPRQVNSTLGTARAASASPPPVVVSIPTRHGRTQKGKTVTLSSVSMGTPVVPTGSSFLMGGS